MVHEEPFEENVDPVPPPPLARQRIREEDELDPRVRENRALEPMDEIEEVCISDTDPTKLIQVGKNLNAKVRAAIIA